MVFREAIATRFLNLFSNVLIEIPTPIPIIHLLATHDNVPVIRVGGKLHYLLCDSQNVLWSDSRVSAFSLRHFDQRHFSSLLVYTKKNCVSNSLINNQAWADNSLFFLCITQQRYTCTCIYIFLLWIFNLVIRGVEVMKIWRCGKQSKEDKILKTELSHLAREEDKSYFRLRHILTVWSDFTAAACSKPADGYCLGLLFV